MSSVDCGAISPVACFGESDRAIHKDAVAELDVECRRLMRMVVGPPACTNWASPWHTLARNVTLVEQQSRGAVELCWIETFVCHMHRGNMDVSVLCSNRAACPRNVGPAGFWNGPSEDHGNKDGVLTLRKERCKRIACGRAVAIGLWRLLRMISGCGRNRIL